MLPPQQLSLALVKGVRPEAPLGQQVEFGEMPKIALVGQVFLILQSPAGQMLPASLEAGAQQNELRPLTARWYCDQCAECREALLDVLCRAKGIERTRRPKAETLEGRQASRASAIEGREMVDNAPASGGAKAEDGNPDSPPPSTPLERNANDNSSS